MNIQKFLRDKPTTLLMIVGFAVACFVLLNISDLIGKIMAESDAQDKFAYSATVFADAQGGDVFGEKQFDDVIYFLQSVSEANIFIGSIPVFVNGEPYHYSGEILITANEDLKMQDTKGRPIDVFSEGSGCVVIGEMLSKHLSDAYGDNSQFFIKDAACGVMGVLRTDMLTGVDDPIMFIWDKMDEGGRAALKDAKFAPSSSYSFHMAVNIIIKSDAPIEDVYRVIVQTLESEMNLETELWEAEASPSQMSFMYKYYNIAFYSAALVFAALTVFSICGIWIAKRKGEFVVRKAYGYTKLAMWRLLFLDAMKIALVSFALAAVAQTVYCIAFDVVFDVTSYFFVKCLSMAAGIIIIVLLMVNRALNMIDRFSIIEGLGKGGV